jgi:hypothetical protein
MLTESERFNLLWLANAMTLPIGYLVERYYYDSRDKVFFSAITDSNLRLTYVDRLNNELTIGYACDLSVRLEFIDDDSSEIVEISRFTVDEKISLQLEFLSKLPGTYWHNELLAAVEQQQDDYKFVLDTVLLENDNCAPMAPYWDDYKLQFVSQAIKKIYFPLNFD